MRKGPSTDAGTVGGEVGPLIVCIDLDGTLLDISSRYYKIHQDVCREFGLSPFPFRTYWASKRKADQTVEFPGLSSLELRERLGRRRKELLETKAYLAHDRLIPGATETLETLGRNYEVVLITLRRNLETLKWQLDRLGLNGSFRDVLASGDGDRDAVRKSQLIKERVWPLSGLAAIAGDSEADILAGQSLGIATYAVSSGIRTASFLKALGPTAVGPDIRGLPDFLRHI